MENKPDSIMLIRFSNSVLSERYL